MHEGLTPTLHGRLAVCCRNGPAMGSSSMLGSFEDFGFIWGEGWGGIKPLKEGEKCFKVIRPCLRASSYVSLSKAYNTITIFLYII